MKQFNHHNTGTLQNVFVIVHQLVNKEAKLSRQQTHRVEEVRNITHYLSSMAISSLGTNIIDCDVDMSQLSQSAASQ